jgi:hypothetical protein
MCHQRKSDSCKYNGRGLVVVAKLAPPSLRNFAGTIACIYSKRQENVLFLRSWSHHEVHEAHEGNKIKIIFVNFVVKKRNLFPFVVFVAFSNLYTMLDGEEIRCSGTSSKLSSASARFRKRAMNLTPNYCPRV